MNDVDDSAGAPMFREEFERHKTNGLKSKLKFRNLISLQEIFVNLFNPGRTLYQNFLS